MDGWMGWVGYVCLDEWIFERVSEWLNRMGGVVVSLFFFGGWVRWRPTQKKRKILTTNLDNWRNRLIRGSVPNHVGGHTYIFTYSLMCVCLANNQTFYYAALPKSQNRRKKWSPASKCRSGPLSNQAANWVIKKDRPTKNNNSSADKSNEFDTNSIFFFALCLCVSVSSRKSLQDPVLLFLVSMNLVKPIFFCCCCFFVIFTELFMSYMIFSRCLLPVGRTVGRCRQQRRRHHHHRLFVVVCCYHHWLILVGRFWPTNQPSDRPACLHAGRQTYPHKW